MASEYSEDDKTILEAAHKGIKECVEEESKERAKMLDDLRFCTLDQWPIEIRQERENDKENGPRPCLTIDKINQYLTQVVNDMRQGRPGIVVRPQDDAADVETAKILKGLVRNIEDQSNADIPYAVAGENAAKIGLGFFRITAEYVDGESFDQELFIRSIPNTFSVYLGKHILPDGSDAERGYVIDTMPLEKFKETFPKAKHDAQYFEDLDQTVASYWRTTETITVAEEYCFERRRDTLYFLADGTTILKSEYDKWPEEAGERPAIQDKRDTFTKQLKWRKITGCEVLEKRDLPGKYIPIVEVVGREAWVEGNRVLWGLVRPAKDSLRMYNYWASTITERMALSPKQPYVAAEGQTEGREAEWKSANRVNRSVLLYKPIDVNGNALPAPRREGPVQMEAALLQQMQVIEHDVQTSLGMFKAAVGETESQQSGRAILALQRESDTGTYHFGANLGVSVRHAGRILVDLIPHYYDTERVIRIIGDDGEVETARINPNQEQAMVEMPGQNGAMQRIYNPGVGKYDVSITVGPSYNTKRMEAAATFVELAKGSGDPATAAVMQYLTVRNSDFNGADEAAKMLKALLPPPVLAAISQKGAPVPPEAQAKMMQMGQALQQMQAAGQELQQENVKLKAQEQSKMAQVMADAEAEKKRIELQAANDAAEQDRAERKAKAEFDLKKWVSEQEAGLAANKVNFEQQQRVKDAEHERTVKLATDPDYKDAAMLPQMLEALGQMAGAINQGFQELSQVQTQTLAVQQATLAYMQAPKAVSIGAPQKNAEGTITGAMITSRPTQQSPELLN